MLLVGAIMSSAAKAICRGVVSAEGCSVVTRTRAFACVTGRFLSYWLMGREMFSWGRCSQLSRVLPTLPACEALPASRPHILPFLLPSPPALAAPDFFLFSDTLCPLCGMFLSSPPHHCLLHRQVAPPLRADSHSNLVTLIHPILFPS